MYKRIEIYNIIKTRGGVARWLGGQVAGGPGGQVAWSITNKYIKSDKHEHLEDEHQIELKHFRAQHDD